MKTNIAPLARFLLSSFLVSISFAISAYLLLLTTEGKIQGMHGYGLFQLAFLPYLFGAFIYGEGYWQRSDSISTQGKLSSRKEQRFRMPSQIVRFAVVLLLMVLGIVAYNRGGLLAVGKYGLVVVGLAWAGIIFRAWFIYRSQSRQGSWGTPSETENSENEHIQ